MKHFDIFFCSCLLMIDVILTTDDFISSVLRSSRYRWYSRSRSGCRSWCLCWSWSNWNQDRNIIIVGVVSFNLVLNSTGTQWCNSSTTFGICRPVTGFKCAIPMQAIGTLKCLQFSLNTSTFSTST